MKNLGFRVITALIAVPIILGLLYLLPWQAFGVLAGAAMVVAALEFFQMTHPKDRISQSFGLLLTTAVFLVLLFTNFGDTHPHAALAMVGGVVPAAMLFTLFHPGEQPTALARMAALAMGPLYVGTALAAVGCLRRVPGAYVGPGLVVLTLMVAWFSDTAGYFVGKSVKGPKLYPSVSPNKTWSGSIGGVVGSALGAVMASLWYLHGHLPLVSGVLVAAAAGAIGQAGDLCESLIKRSAGVKDSGGILPGHGGILDRLDAMMFVALALYLATRLGWLGVH